jgi:opacity protein-like surface antigen
MMKLLTLALSAMLFALAAAPSANAWVRPEWVVVRWANADCKIWHNDTNAPVGYGWRPVAFAGTWGGAYWKMLRALSDARLPIARTRRLASFSPGEALFALWPPLPFSWTPKLKQMGVHETGSTSVQHDDGIGVALVMDRAAGAPARSRAEGLRA